MGDPASGPSLHRAKRQGDPLGRPKTVKTISLKMNHVLIPKDTEHPIPFPRRARKQERDDWNKWSDLTNWHGCQFFGACSFFTGCRNTVFSFSGATRRGSLR